MKFPIKNIVISAFLTLAMGLFMLASAQNPNSTSANGAVASVAGTIWSGPDTMGRHYTYEFLSDGTMHYTYENGWFTDGTWEQIGDSIYMSINNKYSERHGRITGSHMQGDAWNIKGKKWTWEADKKSETTTQTP